MIFMQSFLVRAEEALENSGTGKSLRERVHQHRCCSDPTDQNVFVTVEMFSDILEVQVDPFLSERARRPIAKVEETLAIRCQKLGKVAAWQVSITVRELDGKGNVLGHEMPRSRFAREDLRVDCACEDGTSDPEAHGCCISGVIRIKDSMNLLGSPTQVVSTN